MSVGEIRPHIYKVRTVADNCTSDNLIEVRSFLFLCLPGRFASGFSHTVESLRERSETHCPYNSICCTAIEKDGTSVTNSNEQVSGPFHTQSRTRDFQKCISFLWRSTDRALMQLSPNVFVWKAFKLSPVIQSRYLSSILVSTKLSEKKAYVTMTCHVATKVPRF